MSDLPARQQLRIWWLGCILVVAVGTTAATAYFGYLGRSESTNAPPPPRALSHTSYLYRSRIEYFCSQCHAYPAPEILPRSAWKHEVEQAYKFFAESTLAMQAPPMDEVITHYEDNAPDQLPLPDLQRVTTPLPVHFEQTRYPGPPQVSSPRFPTSTWFTSSTNAGWMCWRVICVPAW
jgi:hypothetical protein